MNIKDAIQQFRNKSPFEWESVATLSFIIITAIWMNSGSLITENERAANNIPWQQPVLEETSSGLATLFLGIIILRILPFFPLEIKRWKTLLPIYFIMATVFSFLHVSMMIGLRKIFWPILFESNYSFYGEIIRDSLYEYRKDLVTFTTFVLIFTFVREIKKARISRTSPITLKCGNSTVLLQPADFIYAKAAGNYVEIETPAGMKLIRSTLGELLETLAAAGCHAIRVHKSYIVNQARIDEIKPIAGGDMMLTLRSGHNIRASRRYASILKK